MKNRLLSLLVALTMVTGSLAPSVPSYAREESGSITESSDETKMADTAGDEEDAEGKEISAPSEVSAGDIYLPSEETSDDESEEQAEYSEDETPTDEAVSEEDVVPEESQIEDEITTLDNEEDTALQTADTEEFGLRPVDIMFGESGDNKDGSLDKIFGINSKVYKTQYKFVLLPEDYDEGKETDTAVPADEAEFDLIESSKLEEIPAGRKVFVYAKAVYESEDGEESTAFDAELINIVKRKVEISFPQSDSVCAYKPAEGEEPEAALVISNDDEIFGEIEIAPVTGYNFKGADGEEYMVEGCFDYEEAAFNAEGIITGDIILDISELTYEAEGFIPVSASFEFTEDFAASYVYEDEALWPVMVYPYAEGAEEDVEEVEEETNLLKATYYRFGFFFDEGKEKLTFSAGADTVRVIIRIKSVDTGIEKTLKTLTSFNKDIPASYASHSVWHEYLKSNAIDFDADGYAPGEYRLFGEFYEKGSVSGSEIRVDLIETHMTLTDIPSGCTTSVTPRFTGTYDCGVEISGVKNYSDAKLKIGSKLINKKIADDKVSFSNDDDHSLTSGTYKIWFSNDVEYDPAKGNEVADSFTRTIYIPVTIPEITPVENARLCYAQDHDITIFDNEEWHIAVGQTAEIACVIEPSDAYDLGYTLVSDNPKVVSVDHQGNLKGVKAGKAKITATSTGNDVFGNKATSFFTVVVDPSIKLKTLKTMKFFVKPSDFELTYDKAEKEYKDNIKDIAVTVDKDFTGDIYWKLAESSAEIASFSNGEAYSTTAVSGGIASNKLIFHLPGKAVVTATSSSGGIYQKKQITCTVSADGVAVDTNNDPTEYFKNGVRLSGFVGLDSSYKLVATGDAALKQPSSTTVYYANPRNGYFLAGKFVTVGKKMYYLHSVSRALIRGNSDFDTTALNNFCINKKGELQTGIIKIGDKEYYYDPATGRKAGTNAWVPYGKGMTLILNDDGSIGADGIQTDGSQYYYFDKNVVYKGFAYLDNHGKLVSASKATCVAYFDPVTGANVSDDFEIKGKTYYLPDLGWIIYTNLKYTGKDGKLHISDKGGAAIKNKFVTYKNETYYADENGCLLYNCTRVINGKTCTFLGDGKLYEFKDYTPSDLSVYADGEYHTVLLRAAKVGKPTNGLILYYEKGTEIVPARSCPVYDVAMNLLHFTDKNGNLATGLVTYGGSTHWFDEKTAEHGTEEKIVNYKKKLYLCKSDGTINVNIGFKRLSDKSIVYVKDTTGALATGIITVDGRKYIIGSDGTVMSCDAKDGPVLYKGKYYITNYSETNVWDNNIWTSPTGPAIVGKDYEYYVINKDGSTRKGWVTIDGYKYYAFGNGNLVAGGSLRKINGKIYAFYKDDDDPFMLTGWRVFDSVTLVDMDDLSKNAEFNDGPYYFYFDPKTGAAVTGFKKVEAPRLLGDGTMAYERDGKTPVFGPAKKIFFNVDSNKLPVAALASDISLIYKGKKYEFDASGAAKTEKEELIDNDGFLQYRKNNGTIAVGRTLVKLPGGGTAYYFFNSYGNMETDVIRKTGSKWYYYGATGQMSYSMDNGRLLTGNKVCGVFNKDGSIKQFVEYVDGTAHVLKNCLVYYGESDILFEKSLAVIGKNGLPVNGYTTVPIDNLANLTTATDADGKMISDVTGAYLVKAGNKIYASEEGNVLRDTGTMYEIYSCALVPASERDILYALQDKMGGTLKVIVNADGSLSSGTAVVNGRTYHKNKYGVPAELYSCYAKSGKDWYISYDKFTTAKPGKAGFSSLDVVNISDETMESIHINYDVDGKLINVTHEGDRTPVTGMFFTEGFGVLGLKNGKPLTGKQTLKLRAGSYKITLDDFGGNCIFNLGF